jgi:AraC-type DNA-binding domain-containing proteins
MKSKKEAVMRKNLKNRYLLVFLTIALVPLITVSIVLSTFYGAYEKRQIINARKATFDNATLQADALLDNLLRFSDQLSGNLNLYLPTPDSIQETAICRALAISEGNIDFNVQMYFFIRKNPSYIYTAAGKILYKEFETTLNTHIDVNLSGLFFNLMSSSMPQIYRLNSPIGDASPGSMALMVPLGESTQLYQAELLFILPEKALLDVFENELGTFDGSITGMNRYGSTVFSYAGRPTPGITPLTLFQLTGSGVIEKKMEDHSYLFLRETSQTGMITYITAMEESVFFQAWLARQTGLNIGLFILVLFSIIIAFFAARATYRPISKAYSQITGGQASPGKDELEQIVGAFKAVSESVDKLENHLTHNARLIMSHFVLKLINGNIAGLADFQHHETCLAIHFHRAQYATLFLALDPQSNPITVETFLYIMDQMHPAATEIIYAECVIERGIAIILNYDATEETDFPARFAKQLQSRMREAGSTGLSIGLGSTESHYGLINLSFYKAVTAQRSDNIPGIHPYFEESRTRTYPLIDNSLFFESMTYGNAEVAKGAFSDIMDKLETASEPAPLINLMCASVLNNILKVAQKLNMEPDWAKLSAAAEFNDLSGFKNTVISLIEAVCREAESKRSIATNALYTQVINYITANYTGSDFSLSLLAGEIGVSMSKVNALLKENLGCGFTQYVTLLRMKEAKRLLRETDNRVQDIVIRLGYIDLSSFTRKFRQLEGCSPGQYRAMHRS